MTDILQCLKKYGQRLDLEIAKEMGIPLATVRQTADRPRRDGCRHHLQPDPVRERQDDRRVAVPRVGVCAAARPRPQAEADVDVFLKRVGGGYGIASPR